MIVLFNKPMNVLSQFTSEGGWPGLSAYIDRPGIYAAGRLDRDSEGLLVLTDEGPLQARIASPKFKMTKTYWAQVEGAPDIEALQALRRGVALKDGMTRPARADLMDPPRDLWPRDPPVRVRQSIPDAWIALTISEGRNRQVRRMCAAVGHPCLRLIRARIGPWELADLPVGEWCETDIRPKLSAVATVSPDVAPQGASKPVRGPSSKRGAGPNMRSTKGKPTPRKPRHKGRKP